MGYTDPSTETVGGVAVAAIWNTYVRDNFKSLDRGASEIRHIGATPFEVWYPLGMNWYDGAGGTFTAVTLSIGTLYTVPFVSPRGATLDRLAFEVTTGGSAGSVARAGIYAATSATNIYPSALVVDGGEFVTTSTGVKAATISVTLEPDILYWAVYLCGVSAPAIRRTVRFLTVLGVPSTIGANSRNLLSPAQSYGALPSTYPAGATPQTADGPLVVARYSA